MESEAEAGTAAKWIRVSSIADGPAEGCGRAFDLEGLEIAIFNWDREYFALENCCPHLGFPLTEGLLQEGSVICGWHGWRVRLNDGGCHGKTLTARAYPCQVRDGEIWVQVPKRL
jgi:nitrite reductase/ring-hydroxylating ferredoxin subunit